MIASLGLLLWTVLMGSVIYASWIKILHHWKVYLLIVYNMIFLAGSFYIFPLLKRIY